MGCRGHFELADLSAGTWVIGERDEFEVVYEGVTILVVGVELEQRVGEGQRVVAEALLTASLVGLGEHDDDGGVGGFVPEHAPEVRNCVGARALGGDVAQHGTRAGRGQLNGRGIDVVVLAVGHMQAHAVGLVGIDVCVAVAI